jgi:Flp pilus assembly protein TadG
MSDARVRRAESGTSLVEFAVAAPIVAFLLVGLIEIGRFAFFSILAANAARAGAQYGAQDLTTAFDTSGIQNAALQDGQNLPNWTGPGGGITVQQLCVVDGAAPQPCATSGSNGPPQNTIYYVKVQVTGVFNSLLNCPGIPNSVPISGSSMMRVVTQ